ncbi:hypothetical protein NKDENANG_01347 [Candidatus Entotheonellaceae bacterium PAL068K]
MKDLLAYVHPVLQVLLLSLVMATLRLGLILKKHRTRQRLVQNRRDLLQRHVQLGLIFVSCLTGGYLLGLLSMPLLRERAPFGSPHFFFATLALVLFLAGAYTGWRLKQGTKNYADVRDIHGFTGYLGVFITLGVAIMGFSLLP